MNSEVLLLASVFLLGAIGLIGFFKTKSSGFGKYTTSILVLLMVLILSTLLFASGRLESTYYTNILMALVGFAGGLINAKE